MLSPEIPTPANFDSFIESYRSLLAELFAAHGDRIQIERVWSENGWGMPQELFDPILQAKPLSTFIPSEYGGYGGDIKLGLSLLEASSYESLPLALAVGINGALFLQPLSIYGSEKAKKEVFSDFIENPRMGGLMITEPDYGSDALHMETFCQKGPEGDYHLLGTKHWAGLTGHADYWLLTAREKNAAGRLSKDISFFVSQRKAGGIEVEEYYRNPGLQILPYGRNKIDCSVGEEYRLEPQSSGLKMLTDVLHRSRLQFPGMAMGFLRKLLESAQEHCQERIVGRKSLVTYDQVRSRLAKMQAQFTVCSAMCAYSSKHAGCDKDLSGSVISANSVKALITDYMQDASQSIMQLFGAKGFKTESLATRSILDSRAFQIFEGSNDILYQQISEGVIKLMRSLKEKNLYNFLKGYELTKQAAPLFKKETSFEMPANLAQDKLVEMGRALARIISIDLTLALNSKSFGSELIKNSVEQVRSEAVSILSNFTQGPEANFVEDYSGARWQSAVA